jgi:hypothetical protein
MPKQRGYIDFLEYSGKSVKDGLSDALVSPYLANDENRLDELNIGFSKIALARRIASILLK